MKHTPAPLFRSVDLLITDSCNQSCPFCFAKDEMKNEPIKEISIENLHKIVDKLVKYEVAGVNVMGGEPTLHSNFPYVFDYILKNFFYITLATNGIFSDKITQYFKTLPPRYNIQFNITAPGFRFNKKIRSDVLSRISELIPYTSVGVSITDDFLGIEHLKKVIDYLDKKTLKRLVVRTAIEQAVVGNKNSIQMKDFQKIGTNLYNFLLYLEKKGPPAHIFSPKGLLNPCMFTPEQRTYLQKKKLFNMEEDSFRCHSAPWLFKVNSSLSTFQCYPLSTIDRSKIEESTSIKKLNEKYDAIHEDYQKSFTLEECAKCPLHGFGKGKCPGPCLGFRINTLKERGLLDKKFSKTLL